MHLSFSRGEYLSKDQTTVLKGILALCILLCHVVPASKVFQGSVLSVLFGSLGYLSVAAFFFISGYGISAQYRQKKAQYLKSFLKNRVLSIYCLNLFLIILYVFFRIMAGITFSSFDILQSLLIGNTIVSNGWYLQIVLLFYIFWYLTTKYIKKEQMQFAALCAAVLLYVLIGFLSLPDFWFQSSFGFLLGILWEKNKQILDEWLYLTKKRFLISLLVVFFSFCTAFFLSLKGFVFNATISAIFRPLMSCVAATLFVVVFMMINILFGEAFNCKVLQFIGKYSMEIYVLQGIPLHIFKTGVLSIENGWLYILFVIAATLLLAIVLHPVVQFITSIPRKTHRKDNSNETNISGI